MLQAGANIIFKYQNEKMEFSFLRNYLIGDEVSKDLDVLLP